MPLMNMMNGDFPKHFHNNGEFPRFDDGFDETRGYLLCVELSPCRPWVNHHVYWLNANSCWWTIFHANSCWWTTLSTDIWYLWQVSRCPSRHPCSSSTTFRASGILGAHLWSLLYTSMHQGLSKRWGKPPINNNVENHQEMESCYVMFTVTSKLDRHLQWSGQKHSSDRNVCVCVFIYVYIYSKLQKQKR